MKSYKKNNKLKYITKDSPDHLFSQIRQAADKYFADKKMTRSGNVALWVKAVSQFILLFASYYCILHSHSFATLLLSYFAFGFMFLIIGINMGHDAAHHCVTGNRRVDNVLFQLIFGLQGLSGYVWQIRHNFSHHIFPNVYDNDTDLEMSKYILLSPKQKKLSIHKYQHLYAPLIYMLGSLEWIYFKDLKLLATDEHASLEISKIPTIEVVKIVVLKILYITIFLGLPLILTGLPLLYIFGAYILMNFVLSVFLAFTFFISHHVMEAEHAEAEIKFDSEVIDDSYVRHQIVSTVDFSTDSIIGNYLFGGFNLHIAHHLFPNVSHIHYPALTKIIKETLEKNNLDWYKSFSFFDGVVSHFALLKRNGQGIFEDEEYKMPLAS